MSALQEMAKEGVKRKSAEPYGTEHKRKRVAVKQRPASAVSSSSKAKKGDDDIVKAAFMPLDTSADQKYVSKRGKKSNVIPASRSTGSEKSSVIYVGHIPHGFYEDQMRGFFSQFGDIEKLRLSRNRKTGKSKHYAFIKFSSPEVASIVAEAMHNYLLLESMLQVKVLPLDRIHPKIWNGSHRPGLLFRPINWQRREREKHNRVKTPKEQSRHLASVVRKDERRRKKLQAAGIDYDYPELKAIIPPTSKKITFNDNEDQVL